MADSNRDRRLPPAWSPIPGLATWHASSLRPTTRPSSGPPTTVPPSPRSVGPRRATPVGGEYLIVPRRRS